MALKRANLSNKAKAFSIASLVDQRDEESESPRANDRPVSSPTAEMKRSSAKRRKTSPQHEPVCRVEAQLDGKDLWECFYRLGTEMIITKTGRRMFPAMRVSLSNLNPNDKYVVLMDVTPLDNKRHRYSYGDSAWFVAGDADPPAPRKVFVHPDSPFTGLSKHVVSFEKVKLTNNKNQKHGSIILNSMHKYQPRIYLLTNPQTEDYESELSNAKTFVFPETAFMAVTSYQNHLITRLKIYSNPFAKGFRDSLRFAGSTERESYIMSDGFDMCEKGELSYLLANRSLEYSHNETRLRDTDFVTNPAPCWSPYHDTIYPRTDLPQYRPVHGCTLGYPENIPAGKSSWSY